MGDVINLRTTRKARERAEAAMLAARNRVLHGRTKAERLADAIGKARRDARLDGARLDAGEPADGA